MICTVFVPNTVLISQVPFITYTAKQHCYIMVSCTVTGLTHGQSTVNYFKYERVLYTGKYFYTGIVIQGKDSAATT